MDLFLDSEHDAFWSSSSSVQTFFVLFFFATKYGVVGAKARPECTLFCYLTKDLALSLLVNLLLYKL